MKPEQALLRAIVDAQKKSGNVTSNARLQSMPRGVHRVTFETRCAGILAELPPGWRLVGPE